jgi:hypothetical protein
MATAIMWLQQEMQQQQQQQQPVRKNTDKIMFCIISCSTFFSSANLFRKNVHFEGKNTECMQL